MIPVAGWTHFPHDFGRVVFRGKDGSGHVYFWLAHIYEVILLDDEYCKLCAKQ
jgi:hypothetical protein